jgi:hypothetical protein
LETYHALIGVALLQDVMVVFENSKQHGARVGIGYSPPARVLSTAEA